MSNLPKAVQEQLEQAELAMNGFKEKQAEPVEQVEVEAQAEVEAAPEPEVTEKPRGEDPELWKQRYLSYKGHFDAELGRKNEEVKHLQAKIEEIQARLEKQKEPAPESVPGVSDEDIETFGADQVRFVERASRKAVADAMGAFDAKLNAFVNQFKALEGRVGQVDDRSNYSATQMFMRDLEKAVPNFREINANPVWLEWLRGVEPYTKRSWQSLLEDGESALDADRVAAVFRAFEGQSGKAETASKQQANAKLQSQVSPSRSRAQTPVSSEVPANQRTYSFAEIEQFYDSLWRGRIDPSQGKETEMEINRAVAEGRVHS